MNPVRPATKRVIPRPAQTEPLTVDASKEVPAAIAMSPEVKAALAPLASPEPFFREEPDGSIVVPLAYPPDLSRFDIPPVTEIRLRRAKWKDRRNAARRYPVNATNIDCDTCIISELSGLPEHALDEFDSRDISNLQVVLGKLLFSTHLLSEG